MMMGDWLIPKWGKSSRPEFLLTSPALWAGKDPTDSSATFHRIYSNLSQASTIRAFSSATCPRHHCSVSRVNQGNPREIRLCYGAGPFLTELLKIRGARVIMTHSQSVKHTKFPRFHDQVKRHFPRFLFYMGHKYPFELGF